MAHAQALPLSPFCRCSDFWPPVSLSVLVPRAQLCSVNGGCWRGAGQRTRCLSVCLPLKLVADLTLLRREGRIRGRAARVAPALARWFHCELRVGRLNRLRKSCVFSPGRARPGLRSAQGLSSQNWPLVPLFLSSFQVGEEWAVRWAGSSGVPL